MMGPGRDEADEANKYFDACLKASIGTKTCAFEHLNLPWCVFHQPLSYATSAHLCPSEEFALGVPKRPLLLWCAECKRDLC